MSYTTKIKYYKDDSVFEDGPSHFSGDGQAASKVQPRSPVYSRASEVFNQETYMYPAPALYLGQHDLDVPEAEIYLLRFLIKAPGTEFVIPAKIAFLQALIEQCAAYQKAYFPDYEDRFAYLTVRSGALKSVNEDAFHVDGFQGISVPRHIPEQNYIWANSHPTLFSLQPYFVEPLDPAQHNFHDYFNAHTNKDAAYAINAKGVYIMDPYHVHARPDIPEGTRRCFVRLCFSPVEIRDDTNTVNPWLVRGPYNREDIRNRLSAYQTPEGAHNSQEYGLTPVAA
ncbi:MAG: hypothetical protein LRY54_02320 [Alphaproteobacteria bacterium]|nr:hypothetical protein [Alphaproteobacteria bacterium]